MSRYKKRALWAAGGMGIFVILLSVLFFLVPRLINMESYRERILADISRETNGEVDFHKADLSFFPRPQLKIHQGSLSIPGKVNSAFESMSIFPAIFPLFKGEVRASKIRIRAPDVTIYLPERTERDSEKQNLSAFTAGYGNVVSGLKLFASKVQGLSLVVESGKLNLNTPGKPGFFFEDVQLYTKFPPGNLKVNLSCQSSLWKSISLKGSVNLNNFKSHGQLMLAHFQPRMLTDSLFPVVEYRVGDSQLNLNLNFNTAGINVIQAEVQGSIPHLTLNRGKEKLVIKGKRFKGAFQKNEDKISVSLNELNLDSPQLNLSGKLDIDRSSPRIELELEGKDIDIDSTRRAVLAVLGDIPGIQDILGIVKGGRLPTVTFHSSGDSPGDLAKTENLRIEGRVIDGKIWVPEADLNLEAVSGAVVISGGILAGEKLEARLDNSRGRSGKLKLGLVGENAPFHLDVTVDADLAQLPPILKRLLKNGTFVKEIDLLKNLKGNASGRLVLGESTESIAAKVDVSEFNLSARYTRIPYPLNVREGRFSYDNERVVLQNLVGQLGTSSFSGLSVWFDWLNTPHIEVKSGASEIVLEEIYPWLLSFEEVKPALKNCDSASGKIKLSSLDLKGPLFEPARWHFQIDGETRDLVVDTPLLNRPVEVNRGEFSAVPETLSFKEVQSRILDASFRGSGVIDGYLKGLQKADVTFQGNTGPEVLQRISDLINLPHELSIRPPLSFSDAHLIWDRSGKTAFTGKLAVKDGPDISMEILLDSGEFRIKHLLIQDQASHAVVALAVINKALGLDFKGNLDRSTFDNLLISNPFLSGWIKGDFKARILMDQPLKSWIWGSVQGTGLNHPWKSTMPMKIESVSLESRDNRLEVVSALFTWEERRLTLNGTVNTSTDGLWMDLNLWADSIEWDKIENLFRKTENKEIDSQTKEAAWDLPLHGNLRVESEKFRYERFVWSPLIANITFSHDGVGINVIESNLCGISFPGMIKYTPPQIQLDFKPIAREQEMNTVFPCLGIQRALIGGRFDFDGVLTAEGEQEALIRNLRGDLKLNAHDGRIYRSVVLAKIFTVLNVSNIIRGNFSEFSQKGFAYRSIKVGGKLEDGKLALNELMMVAPSMNIVGQGEIDIIDKKVDLTLLVAPLQTVNLVVSKIPVIRNLAGENLVSIPMKVTGDVTDPKVSLFSASKVGSGLIGTMKNALQLLIK